MKTVRSCLIEMLGFQPGFSYTYSLILKVSGELDEYEKTQIVGAIKEAIEPDQPQPKQCGVFVGWARPEFAAVRKLLSTNAIVCRCGLAIRTPHELHDHWYIGHFDRPVHAPCNSEQAPSSTTPSNPSPE